MENQFRSLAIMACAGCATLVSLLLTAPTLQNYIASTSRVNGQYATLAPSYSLRASSVGYTAEVPQVYNNQHGTVAVPGATLQTRNETFGPLLLVASGALLMIAAAVRYMLPTQRPATYESLALMATSGEQVPASQLPGPAVSRRDMGPLLTGVMLSPAIAAQAIARPALAAEDAAATATAAATGGSIVIENPKAWIKTNLPGALRGKEFVRLTADILNRQGMSPENTVACVGVCRDELCQPIVDEIESEWGDAFNMTSLGGMLTLGKTGLKAAMAHSPVDSSGRERYFFMAFPHISVDTAGVGICTRPGRPKPSKACGALYAFTSELQSGKVSTEYNPIDPEYSFMKQALLELIPDGDKPDLLDVTKTAAEASLAQIEQLVAATVDTSKADYAICIGVLVHEQDLRGRSAKVIGPARQYVDQVWPTAFYSVVKGRKKDLIWRLEID